MTKDGKNEFLESQIKKNRGIKWSKTKRTTKDLNDEMVIQKDISKTELDLRYRSFHHENFPLELNLHGYRFILDKKNEE
jgi:hypothetical protein|tara:strand:- start:2972 stop:3208 length:237 start_codon:yes stop_codon:yes gene_type:complete